MQKLFLGALILVNSQAIAMSARLISAQAAKVTGTKATNRTIAVCVAMQNNTDKHLKYIHDHDAYLAQQLKNTKPLNSAEINTRAKAISTAIKRVGFLSWEQYSGFERAHQYHTELAAKSAMLDCAELLPVIHACENALALEIPLLKNTRAIKFPFTPEFTIYPFRFGAGLKLYNTTYRKTRAKLTDINARITQLADPSTSVAAYELTKLKADRQHTMEYLRTNFAAKFRI